MRQRLTLVSAAVATVLISAPVIGWPPVVRLSAVLMSAAVLAVWAVGPWRWQRSDWEAAVRWEPSPRVVAIAAFATSVLLFWIVFTRFQNGNINAVDFTIYFDRPLFQTSRGRPFFVETTDDPSFAYLSHLAVHAYWVLLPLSGLYWVYATPLWLLGLSVVAVVAGGIYVLRIALRLGTGGIVASAAALVYVLNDNTARTLNYGFHAEVLYAWFVPMMLDAGLRGARRSYLAAAVACVLVKEDACLPIFAVAVALALVGGRKMTIGDRLLFLVVPTALAFTNLALYYRYVVPALAPGGGVMYAHFWAHHGATPFEALRNMVSHPGDLVRDAWSSGFLPIVMPPFLFLPAIGWRWSIDILPIVVIFAASDNEQVRGFGIYYSIVLVPFLVLGAASGAVTLAQRLVRPPAAPVLASIVLVCLTLLAGRGYSLRPWKSEVSAVPRAIDLLANERTVLVQSGLYPHAGYEARIKLLTPHALGDPANDGVAALLAPTVSAYPFRRREVACLAELPVIGVMPDGLIAVRVVPPPADAIDGSANPTGRRNSRHWRRIFVGKDCGS